MHYYKRNIGDYAKKAGRLSMLEHGAYTLLIDACYDRERFPTRDEAIEWTWARSDEEIAAVEFVLSRFFECVDGVYTQSRIQEELDAYHSMAAKNKEIATNREQNRRTGERSVNGASRSVDETPPNHKPLTKNQEPSTKRPRLSASCDALFDAFWKAYPKKVGKDEARKAFDKRKPTAEMAATMLTALGMQAQSIAWTKDDGQFIPNPATWLNQGRWQDEIGLDGQQTQSMFAGAI